MYEPTIIPSNQMMSHQICLNPRIETRTAEYNPIINQNIQYLKTKNCHRQLREAVEVFP